MGIIRIISGGQTGADRGGLDSALRCRISRISYGGWCPKGRRAEDGIIPDKYQLQETESTSYVPRTEANVVDSDATLIFTIGKLSGGSLRTLEFAQKHQRPVLHIDIGKYSREEAVKSIVKWLAEKATKPTPPRNCVLNVAGQRESKAPGIQEKVTAIMVDVLIKNNPECKRAT